MNKILIWMLVLLTLPALVSAQEICTVNETCEWWAVITDSGMYLDADGANLTIYYPNASIMEENVNMTKVDTGRFLYSNNLTVTGTYLGSTEFYNATGTIAIASQSKVSVLGDVDMDSNIIAIVFFIGIVLAFLAYYSKNVYTMALAALWFVLAAVTTFLLKGDVLGIPGWAQTIFFTGLAGVLGVNAWFYYNRNKQERSEWDN